jgi:RNA-directed DNA polymerase
MPSYYDRLCNRTLLLQAWKSLNKTNRFSHGLDNVTIDDFRARLEENIDKTAKQLKKRKYEFVPLRAKPIEKEGGGTRLLRIPAVKDRVVMTALKSLISHRFRRFDLACSHGYVPGRSPLTAVRAVRALRSSGLEWVLEADIKKFFDTVDRGVLVDKFIENIRIPSIVPLLRQAIATEVGNLENFGPADQAFLMADSGIPQGGVLSPMLANFYLYPFDKAMENAGYQLIRYADDFVVLSHTFDEAKRAYDLCLSILEGKLSLSVHHLGDPGLKTRIIKYSEGFTFLGVEFRGEKVFPSPKAIKRFRERIAAILSTDGEANLLNTLSKLKNTIVGWGSAYRFYHSTEIFQNLDDFIREQIARYFRAHNLLASRYGLSRKDVRFIGVPSLLRIKQGS